MITPLSTPADILSQEDLTCLLSFPHRPLVKALLNLIVDSGLGFKELSELQWTNIYPGFINSKGKTYDIRPTTYYLLLKLKRFSEQKLVFSRCPEVLSAAVRAAFLKVGLKGCLADLQLAHRENINAGKDVIVDDATPNTASLVSAFITSCESRALSSETIRYYRDFLVKFTSAYKDLPLDPEAIERFIASFTSGDRRRHACFRALRAFYNFLKARYSIVIPFEVIKPPRLEKRERTPLTLQELKQLLDYPHEPRIKLLLYFLADTGARIGEAANLNQEDIFKNNTARIRGKTGEHIIPISDFVVDMLRELGPGKLWPGKAHWLTELVKKAFVNAGLPQFSAHSLRHTLATTWGGSPIALKTIGGWSSWRMVENYTHNNVIKAQAEQRLHSPLVQIYGKQY